MDIFEFAMQMEQDGEAYYRELAANTKDEGLRAILNILADEERKHFNTFKALKESRNFDFGQSTLFRNVKNIFEEAREKGSMFETHANALDHYTKAREVEKKAEDFYRQKAKEVEGVQKKYLLLIAEEEHRHFQLLENMIEMVSRPQNWIENAEWNNMQEY